MKIGNGWTKNTKNGDTYISITLDEVIKELYPQLKDCYINLWYMKKEDRKNENSPSWTISLSTKQEKQNNTTDDSWS